MSIEQHTGPDPAPDSSGADLAHLLHGLTLSVLGLPDVEPADAPTQPEQAAPPVPPARRHGSVLSDLGFLDD